MALFNTLMRLKEDGLVKRFDMLQTQKAKIYLHNNQTIIAYMSDDYVIGITSIRESIQSNPQPDYIVYNDWDKVTEPAEEEAKRLRIPLVKYGRFRYILKNLLEENT